jgi:hypothetical protein
MSSMYIVQNVYFANIWYANEESRIQWTYYLINKILI